MFVRSNSVVIVPSEKYPLAALGLYQVFYFNARIVLFNSRAAITYYRITLIAKLI